MEINNQTEATMQATLTPTHRYGFNPAVPFAATRACAERRARETAAAAARDSHPSRSAQHLIRSLATRLTRSRS